VLFVLASLYCTYWWNYLRAQNAEIYQTLFVLGLYYHFTGAFHRGGDDPAQDRRNLVLAGIFLGMLILVKAFFVVLVPSCLLALFYCAFCRSRNNPGIGLAKEFVAIFRSTIWFLIPLSVALGILLWVNWYKFGSPFDTGYGEWSDENRPIFSGDFLSGILTLLFSIRGSIFLYFPVFTIGLIGFWQFVRRWPQDSFLFLTMGATLFLLNAKMFGVLGGWCYGPRYMLPVLPLLSIPFIQTLNLIGDEWRRWWIKSLAVVIALLLLFSLRLQLNVNAMPFFLHYDLELAFADVHDASIEGYFDHQMPGLIDGDVFAFKQGKPWLPIEVLANRLPPEQLTKVETSIRDQIILNYYWWH
jgi:hypothetical protein